MWATLRSFWWGVPTAARVGLFLVVCTMAGGALGLAVDHDGIGALMGLAFGVGVVVGDAAAS